MPGALLLSIIDFKRKQLRNERFKKSTCPQLVTEHPVAFNKTSCQILMLSPYKKMILKFCI